MTNKVARIEQECYQECPLPRRGSFICPGGGIGRHARLRVWWPRGREGSSPFLGTINSSRGKECPSDAKFYPSPLALGPNAERWIWEVSR